MWPQMIDEMMWPFAMKAVAERLNSLQVNTLDLTPELILHGIDIENIPVKSYHTLFCPLYVLDSRLQDAGDAGPPKWDRVRTSESTLDIPCSTRAVLLLSGIQPQAE